MAGFKPKTIKPKKPDKFHAQAVVSGITYASDLLLNGKEQKKYFCKELAPQNVIVVRLAIFNNSSNKKVLPLERIRLIDPDGKEVPALSPATVAQAVIQGITVDALSDQPYVRVVGDPDLNPDARIDRTDPRRQDPNDPRYDPRLDPNHPDYNCYPNSPCDKARRRAGIRPRPSVGVVLNPYGKEYGEISSQLIEKDFIDKAHSTDPILPSMKRDKFLYFKLVDRPASVKGFELLLPRDDDTQKAIHLKY